MTYVRGLAPVRSFILSDVAFLLLCPSPGIGSVPLTPTHRGTHMKNRLSLMLYDLDRGESTEFILTELDLEETRIVKESEITRTVTASLWRKQIDGAKEHGRVMRPGDDVDALQNAFEETLDLAQYLMKAITEVKSTPK
ncbi:hypothetical protein LCGC14_1424520 [marine sediment metagenome]|uniref:Uncharacterized protein n=1 Tax=marine sediment metagenome TaxID=412755 RepID=A0A0F9KBI3_9ZZZZ